MNVVSLTGLSAKIPNPANPRENETAKVNFFRCDNIGRSSNSKYNVYILIHTSQHKKDIMEAQSFFCFSTLEMEQWERMKIKFFFVSWKNSSPKKRKTLKSRKTGRGATSERGTERKLKFEDTNGHKMCLVTDERY